MAADPWVEQARRRRARRRRRIIRGAVVVAGVLLAAWIGVAIWALAGRSDETASESATTAQITAGGSEVPGTVDHTAADPEVGGATDSPGSSDPDDTSPDRPTAESFVVVDEAWLLGHEDGTVDWGVIVASISDVDRGPIRIDAVFRDGDGAEVAATSQTLSGVAAGGFGVLGGNLPTMEPVPVRLQVDVAVGRPLEVPAFDGAGLDVRSLDRRTRADGVDEVTGLVVPTRDGDVSSLQLVLVWRDPQGSVVGSVVRDVDRVRAGVPAHFAVALAEDRVPDGLPTEVIWSQLGSPT